MDNLHKDANPELFHFARLNRQAQTEAEQILWSRLRNGNLKGFKFRRQHPVANFIADFFCFECNLVVEVDGDYHNEAQQRDYHNQRTDVLKEFSIKVIRFTNREVTENINDVLERILKHLKSSRP